jgi:hypothetical protein
LLERIPPTDPAVTAFVPDEGRFVDKRRRPFREDDVDLTPEETGGAGGFVSLFKFFPNFFLAVGSDDCCVILVTELISKVGMLALVAILVAATTTEGTLSCETVIHSSGRTRTDLRRFCTENYDYRELVPCARNQQRNPWGISLFSITLTLSLLLSFHQRWLVFSFFNSMPTGGELSVNSCLAPPNDAV